MVGHRPAAGELDHYHGEPGSHLLCEAAAEGQLGHRGGVAAEVELGGDEVGPGRIVGRQRDPIAAFGAQLSAVEADKRENAGRLPAFHNLT